MPKQSSILGFCHPANVDPAKKRKGDAITADSDCKKVRLISARFIEDSDKKVLSDLTCKSSSNTALKLPENSSEWMRKSVEQWHLQAPYTLHDDEKWKRYYQERASLDWRNKNAWDEDGIECPKEKIQGEFSSKDFYNREKLPEWTLEWGQPELKPLCAESYARDCGWQSDREEFEELLDHIRRRVTATLSSCKSLPAEIASVAASGCYILQYWINKEDCSKNADVRTCHFETRFYVPIGSGVSVDLHYRYHYRARSFSSEKFSDLYSLERDIENCDPRNPTPVRDWQPCKIARSKDLDSQMSKLLCQEKKKKTTHATKGVLHNIAQALLPDLKISHRKVWSLLARAGGLWAAGEKSGEHFLEARRKFGKLGKGEESDEEEKGRKRKIK